MHNRSRALLGLALFASQNQTGDITRTRLIKYAFLLAKRCGPEWKEYLYDFVPYHFGPFSFELYRDVAELAEEGFVDFEQQGEDEKWTLVEGRQQEARKQFDKLPWEIRSVVGDIAYEHKNLDVDVILRRVYAEYPWYASRSNREDLVPAQACAPQAQIMVYTAGYEGKSLDAFFNGLMTSGIQCIIDVRRNLFSHKYGFSGSTLRNTAIKLQFDYEHFPQLGIASSERQDLGSEASYQRLFDTYEKSVLEQGENEVARVIAMLRQKPSTLLCVERDPARCHRGRLAAIIARETGLPVHHLP